MTSPSAPARLLLLGETGLLGSHLARHLTGRYRVFSPRPRRVGPQAPGLVRLEQALVPGDARGLEAVLEESRPEVIINAMGVTPASDECRDAEAVIAVNALLPQQLAARAVRRGVRLIHVSTDGVFSGRTGTYRESDQPDPVDLYGRSKLAGEVEGPGCLNVRTSFFGRSPKGTGLIEWLIARDGSAVEGYTDYFFSGVAAPVLAEVVGELAERSVDGVIHAGGARVSKYDVLVTAVRALGLNIRVIPATGRPADRSLDSSRLQAVLGRGFPSLDVMMSMLAGSTVARLPGAGG